MPITATGIELDVVVPYDRGDLVARAHEHGEVLHEEHTAAGTQLRVRVDQQLAAELTPFTTVTSVVAQ